MWMEIYDAQNMMEDLPIYSKTTMLSEKFFRQGENAIKALIFAMKSLSECGTGLLRTIQFTVGRGGGEESSHVDT